LKSANDNPSILKEKNVKEIKAGRVTGPFDISPFTNIPFRSCSEKESGKISGYHNHFPYLFLSLTTLSIVFY
jgi:hypothetical protein